MGYQTHLSTKLPTRLIDVGDGGDVMVKLWEPNAEDMGSWLALSHPWGELPHFSTKHDNCKAHLQGIILEDLPQTFKDAVNVTRALGFKYLWIDSLCIIQGAGGDFQQESTRMEEVYSGASCVIAASRSTGHYSGFLGSRIERHYVTLKRKNSPGEVYHICQLVDDFNNHVLHGALNGRGWVLQEHALARRTIFFTSHQTYWECGHGVRCETMTHMWKWVGPVSSGNVCANQANSNSAALLGDPNFPRILIDAKQGERIIRCQDLYKRYSRLGLAQAYDRPTAIDGMQQRLLRTMNLKGGFGVFDEGHKRGLLRRSLLWRRPDGILNLRRIQFSAERGVCAIPTWSWMAFDGAIDYLQLDFGGLDWADLQSPWFHESRQGSTTLFAYARTYSLHDAALDDHLIVLDTPDLPARSDSMCVILGTQTGSGSSKVKRHYVLFVTAITGHYRQDCYERIGTGYISERCITGFGTKVYIH